VDLSSPKGHSVNDAIDPHLCTLTYCGMEDATREIRVLGQNTVLAKVDIKSAYWVVPVNPDDSWLLGMCWKRAV